MSAGIWDEVNLFIASFVLGAVYAGIDDLLRLFRKWIRHNSFWTAVEDFLYWLSLGGALFILIYQRNDGRVRGYVFVGMFLGAVQKKHINRILVKVAKRFRKHGKSKENL